MLQQQLRQKDEDISAKAAEIGELKERLAELEKLKDEQQKLLSLKDTELATAQQRLAEANRVAAAPATPPAAAAQTASQQPTPPADHPAQPSPTPYLWAGIGLFALALLGWLLFGRRKRGQTPVPPRRSSFDSEALAASMVPQPSVDAPAAPAVPADPPVIDLDQVPPTPPKMDMPTWHSGWVKADAPPPAPPQAAPTPRFVPAEEPLPDLSEPVPPQASVEQRFKLARAFLDIGDSHSARELLIEIMNEDDDVASAEAAKLLSKLVGR